MDNNLPNNQNVNTPPQKTTPVVDPQPQPTTPPVEQTPPKRKPSTVKIIMSIIILLLLSALGSLIYQNNQLKSQISYKPMETSAPSLEPTPTPNPTANWNSYTNTAFDYSIKYPLTFLTQNMSAGAGTSEALPTSTHLYVYNTEDEKHYLNRYVNIEHLGLIIPKSNGYNETNTTVGNKSAIKYTSTDPEVLFDIYVINFDNDQGGLEIYVSKSEDKQQIAEQILSSFEFTDGEFVCPDTNIIDCTPCTGGPCPLMFPAYCSKGSAQYNWIVENCPDVTFIGLE